MKSIKFEVGQFFLVPNSGGSYYIGQIAEIFPELTSVFCYFLDESGIGGCPSSELAHVLSKKIVAAAMVTPELLKRGVWKSCDLRAVVSEHPLLAAARALRELDFVGVTVNGAGLVPQFLDTHFGRLSWDHWASPHLVTRFLEASGVDFRSP